MPVRPVHSRTPLIETINVSEISIDPAFQCDQKMVQLVVQLERGKIRCAYSRIREDEITSGFFRRVGGEPEHVTNLTQEHVIDVAATIRRGHRPAIGVYWSPHSPFASKYVCPDDEVTLAAYRSLGIKNVPCMIYRPHSRSVEEAAIWCEKKGNHIRLAKSVPTARTHVEMMFGVEDPPFDELISSLTNASERTRRLIRRFHLDDLEATHYHQVLHAILRRHEEFLSSIRVMVEQNRLEHAEGLARMCYEAFLNFYLDWLAPWFFGPRFQLLSAVRYAELAENDPKELKELRDSLSVLQNFTQLLETTADKARLSPLGSIFHSMVYPPLSLVSHQSYSNLEAEAVTFSDTVTDAPPERVRQLGRWLDAITTAMVVRIRDDAGSAVDPD